jgi:hypothetical protein
MRIRLYKALRASTDLAELVENRIIEASAVGTTIWPGTPPRPFLTYRMHTDFPVMGGVGRREYCQLWANDDPGDYEKIDEILRLSRIAVEAIPHTDDFLEARWVETGVDLEDKAMGTINRYIRFQFTGTLRERTWT